MNKFGIDLTQFVITDLLSLCFYGIGSIYLCYKLGQKSRFLFNLFLGLSFVHLLMTIGYWFYSLSNNADAYFYYSVAASINHDDWLNLAGLQGTSFVIFLTYPLIEFFGLSYLGCYFVFSFIGLGGFYLLFKILEYFSFEYNFEFKRSNYYLLLIPGAHFWSCAIGKDSIIFYFIVLFLYSFLRKKWTVFIIACIGIALVRSHILVMFLVGISSSIILYNKRLNIFQKSSFVVIFLLALVLLMPLVSQRIGLEDINSADDLIERQLTKNQGGGSSVDMANSNVVVKFFSYLFRPLFFDARSVTTLVSSFENLLWIYMCFEIVKSMFKTKRKLLSRFFLPFFFTVIIITASLSSILNNLGIAVRQKTMIFPLIIMLFFLSDIYKNMRLKSIRMKTDDEQ